MTTTTPTLPATESNEDRTRLVPPHIGRHVLPNSPLFVKLSRHACCNRLAIRDNILKIKKPYGDLLADVLTYRAFLESSLESIVLERIERNDEIYIGVLAARGYEFTVAILAVHALEAAVVPMTTKNPVEKAAYFEQKAFHSSSASNLAHWVKDRFASLASSTGQILESPKPPITEKLTRFPITSAPVAIHNCFRKGPLLYLLILMDEST
ncbi:uncharacterized protein N7498_000546 [Penicillium cinerascens]|uniref:Uncharacterized protein n=1 Tax=Penicillium cinerascens TaxID=70096 RepID=A0A9W9TD59_9EURO|nr:uncharacterized protein N7498_000546 [Penicillium cinerascens]KAJ5218447.1 hypothetical protein N7498_000546 [Penicillium cinerascens]